MYNTFAAPNFFNGFNVVFNLIFKIWILIKVA